MHFDNQEQANISPAVIIILDPEFGDRLVPLLPIAPIWIVATEFNKTAYTHLWKENKHDDHRVKGAITAFNVVNPEQRLNNLLDVIPDVELHHALVEGDVIEVIGVNLGKDTIEGLQKDNFSSFVKIRDAFRASKVLTPSFLKR